MTTQRLYRTDPTVFTPVVFGAAASAWATSTGYVVGQMVTYGGSTYFCLVAHTSGTWQTDLDAGKWLLVTPILWAPQNEGTGKGRQSAVWDRGSGNLPFLYRYRCSTRWAATPAAGDALRLYLPSSYALATAALADGNIAFGDAEVSSEANWSNNCDPLVGPIVATALDQLWLKSGMCEIYARYVSLGGWNTSATKALTNTASDHWCMFQPMPLDIEAPV